MRRTVRLAFEFVLLGTTLLWASTSLADTELVTQLQPGAEAGSVVVVLGNTGDSPIWVLRWGSPFDTVPSADLFSVTRAAKGWPDDERLEYIGRRVKRGRPSPGDYLRIDPGQQASREISLGLYYNIPQADIYEVDMAAPLQYRTSDPSDTDTTRASSAWSTAGGDATGSDVVLDKSQTPIRLALAPDDRVSARYRPPDLASCSIEQARQVEAAIAVSEAMTQGAVDDLASLTLEQRPGSPRYSLWFGAYEPDRFQRVQNGFAAMKNVLLNQTLSIDCTCDENGVFAYVFPNRPYEIFLCPAFWAADPEGTDSRGGTLIHELSHFTAISGTDDFRYGQTATQILAQSSPELAVNNADNFEYFAENTPDVPIVSGSADAQSPTDGAEQSLPPEDDGMTTPVVSDGTEPADGQPGNVVDLTPDVAVADRVERREIDAYSVRGADLIELSYATGDADLYVYSDPQFARLICRADAVSSPDNCPVDAGQTVYLKVYGYRATDYRLLAAVGSGSGNTGGVEVVALVAGVPVDGQVQERAVVSYSLEGAAVVTLQSLSGDADLYVYSSPTPREDTLVCSSYSVLPVDECDLSRLAGTSYVFVYGYRTADYTLLARRVAAEAAADEPVDGDEAAAGDAVVGDETAVAGSTGIDNPVAGSPGSTGPESAPGVTPGDEQVPVDVDSGTGSGAASSPVPGPMSGPDDDAHPVSDGSENDLAIDAAADDGTGAAGGAVGGWLLLPLVLLAVRRRRFAQV